MKMSEIKEKTNQELDQIIADAKKELLNLRIMKASGKVVSPSRFRNIRLIISRILTFYNLQKINKG